MNTFFDWFHTSPQDVDEDTKELFIVSNYATAMGFLTHLCFLVFFIVFQIQTLALFNILSILIFATAFVFVRVGNSPPLILAIVTIEILAHGALAIFTLGLNSGFHFYLFGATVMWLIQNIELKRKIFVSLISSFFTICLLYLAPKTVENTTISQDMITYIYLGNAAVFASMLIALLIGYNLSVTKAKLKLQHEYARSEKLLHNILPPPIASRLKEEEGDSSSHNIADGFPVCSVLFADIVGFTVMSQQMDPVRLVSMLNDIFSHFDNLAEKHGLEKIKTIGDAYMVASGIPVPNGNHARDLADFSLDMRHCMEKYSQDNGLAIQIRIGIHSGPAVAGVIGKKKFIYDVWGDTVNTAARMESHGKPGEIHISNLTKELLGKDYVFEDCGQIQVKGKGEMHTWLLKSACSKVL